MFLVLLHYKRPLHEVDALLAEHNAFLDRHYLDGHFLMSGRREPRTGGVILARAASREEVEALFDEDPFKRNDIADYQVIEFLPTRSAAELASLVP